MTAVPGAEPGAAPGPADVGEPAGGAPWPDSTVFASLPQPYGRWVTALLGRLPAAEPRASCHDCAMCTRPGDPEGPAVRIVFDPLVRCCTYQPQMPNYLAGAVLASTDAALVHGRESLARRIDAGDATLLGVRVAPGYLHLYRAAGAASFGRARSLRCPHHRDEGGCGLWAHRPAVCATWFCKHERGQTGARQWQALHGLLSAAERVVSLWCLRRLGVPAARQAEALAAHDGAPQLEPAALDRRPDAEAQVRAWGDWHGREAAFYAACAEQVAGLDWEGVLAAGGSELALLADRVVEAVAHCDDLALPPRVRTGSFSVHGSAQGRVWLHGYSEFDPLAVAPEVLALAARCDGRRWDQVADGHAAALGARPSRLLLRTLLDFGIVQPAGDDDGDGEA